MAGAPELAPQSDRFVGRLETFRDRLLQVDWRNRSILLRKIHQKWSFDLAGLGPLFEGTATDAAEKALRGKGTVSVVLDSDSSDTAETVRTSLTALERSVRLFFEESGLDDCYLGFPFLVGHIAPDKFVRAPVVLFPVALERVRRERGSGWNLTFSEDEPPVLNRALLAALGKVRGISLPKGVDDTLADLVETAEGSQAEVDAVLAFMRRLHRMLEEASVPVIDAPPVSAKPEPIDPMTAESVAALAPTRLHLVAHAVVGSFPQGSTAIYTDYNALIERASGGETNQGIVDDLLEAPDPKPPTEVPESARRVDSVPDRLMNFALPSDGSQDAVLVEAQIADCVVVRGPPGTGKSQVIVNLITDALARGERVLVVCQKRAALDVVFQRLERAGLSDAAVLIHDARADRSAQYKRLARRMEGNPPLVDERRERVFGETTDAIDQTVAELNTLVKPLWAELFGGVRPYELYGAATPGFVSRIPLSQSAGDIALADLKAALEAMPKLQEGFTRFDGGAAAFAGRTSFARAGPGAKNDLAGAVRGVLASAVDPARLVGSVELQSELVTTVRNYNRMKAKAWRFILPAWWRTSKEVSRLAYNQHPEWNAVDGSTLQTEFEAGLLMGRALAALQPWIAQDGWARREGGQARATFPFKAPAELRARAGAMLDALPAFDAMVEHDRRIDALSPRAAALYHDCAAAFGASKEPWGPILKQEVYLAWIGAFEAQNPQMGGEPFARYLELRARLERLLESRREVFVAMLSDDLARRSKTPKLGPGVHHPNKRPQTEWRALAHEFQKQRRVKTVRRLLDEYRYPFGEVSPCWLASPEAVSDIFPLERGLFDLVIFDEASQLAVERALPTIYRGKRTVIAGDEKQLRPFDLFQLQADDDEEEREPDAVTEAESLLVLAMRIFSPRYLSWHYRSKFQELIDFSNHAFYDGKLQIAGNVTRLTGLPPIDFVRVNGVWQDRANQVEADQVVDILLGLLKASDGKAGPSLGVITFNDQQRNLIMDTVDARRTADPEFDRLWAAANAPERLLDDRPFVKNLENVQGDERDIILFSVGYAPAPDGKMRVQFGSLNQMGGENRLNVAVTRARQRVVMVASFDPKSLPVEGTKNEGPMRLKQYLVYAEAVSKLKLDTVKQVLQELDPSATGAPPTNPSLNFEKPFEAQLKESLEAAGLKVEARVGFSDYRVDLAVSHPQDPGRYVLGVECDGSTFHSARSARERDVERQRFLEAHGWTLERAWSRTFWADRPGEIERIRARVRAKVDERARAPQAPGAHNP